MLWVLNLRYFPYSRSQSFSPGSFLHLGFFFYINLFILFLLLLAALGLRCCVQAFSSCGERGLLLVAVHWLLIAVASLVAEHGL